MYHHYEYVATLEHIGTPLHFTASDSWVLARTIANTAHYDLCSSYPLLSCEHWNQLGDDLATMDKRYLSFVAVIDPLADISPTLLSTLFPDHLQPFKTHFMVQLERPFLFSAHHRRNIKIAARSVEIEPVKNKTDFAATWCALYATLSEKHSIRGPADFTQAGLCAQLALPWVDSFAATHNSEVIGAALFVRHGAYVYYHLGAHTAQGYQLGSAYALFDYALHYYREQGFSVLNLGGASGTTADNSDGLGRFKRGWSNDSREVLIGGRIGNANAYSECSAVNAVTNNFFPAYRAR